MINHLLKMVYFMFVESVPSVACLDPFVPYSLHAPQDNVPFLRYFHDDSAIDIPHASLSMHSKERESHLISPQIALDIKSQIEEIVFLSPKDYAHRGQDLYKPDFISSTHSNDQMLIGQKGLFAIKHMPAYHVIGLYAGYYLKNMQEFESLYQSMHPVLVDRYMHACTLAGFPAISGYVAGNYTSYINDWRPFGEDGGEDAGDERSDLQQLQINRQNTVSVIFQIKDLYLVAYVTIKEVLKGQEFLTDYGDGYWEREDFIKKAMKEN